MTHRGRAFDIGSEAEAKSKKVVDAVPREKLWIPYGRMLRRPLWYKVQFQDTQEERRFLKERAIAYNTRYDVSDPRKVLLAHGTHDASHFCQILLDGELRHKNSIENYGDLRATGESITIGGYYDHGWGIFIATLQTIQAAKEKWSDHYQVPLANIEAILLPTPLVEIVRREFPQYTLIKGYRQFGEELEKRL